MFAGVNAEMWMPVLQPVLQIKVSLFCIAAKNGSALAQKDFSGEVLIPD
jgi:hypothetical protein